MSCLRNRVRWAVTVNCILIIASIALDPVVARADDSPCTPVAEAISAEYLHIWVGLTDATSEQSEQSSADEIRDRLLSIEPAMATAMWKLVSDGDAYGSNVLSRVDIDNDGSDDWWLKTSGGSAYCETNWFFDSEPPFHFMGRIGSTGAEEAECGFTLEAIRINGKNYLSQWDYRYHQLQLMTWRAPGDFADVCSITWDLSSELDTTTECAPVDQTICDAIAARVGSFKEGRVSTGETGAIDDLASIAIENQPPGFLAAYDVAQSADIDNDGDTDILASRQVFEDWGLGARVGFFLNDAGRFSEVSAELISWRLQRADAMPSRTDVVLSYESKTLNVDFDEPTYAITVDGTTYIVQREPMDGIAPRFQLRIFEIVGEFGRMVGTVAVKPIPTIYQ